MALSLYKISQTSYSDEKKAEFAQHLWQLFAETENDYKILGKYEIKKDANLNISLMNDIDERYIDECTLCCDEQNENVNAEKQFQTLFEIVRDHECIPKGLVDQMDDNNKEAAQVWNQNGVEAAVEHMTRGMREGKMSYSQMREMYG
jgi:hypothetical protein